MYLQEPYFRWRRSNFRLVDRPNHNLHGYFRAFPFNISALMYKSTVTRRLQNVSVEDSNAILEYPKDIDGYMGTILEE